MLLSRDFRFSAAHHLPRYHGKCERVHGHNYRLRVTIEGELDEEGMILDFAEVKKIVQAKVLEQCDHTDLNEMISNPSAENIAIWVWQQLKNDLNLFEVRIWETANASVILRRGDVEELQ